MNHEPSPMSLTIQVAGRPPVRAWVRSILSDSTGFVSIAATGEGGATVTLTIEGADLRGRTFAVVMTGTEDDEPRSEL
jgi:hypothetical protein